MTPTLTVSVGVGGFIAGFVLGHLIARRGRRLRIGWHLTVEADEGTNWHDPDPDHVDRPRPPPQP